jgi:hypothetical protein
LWHGAPRAEDRPAQRWIIPDRARKLSIPWGEERREATGRRRVDDGPPAERRSCGGLAFR